MTEDFKLVFNEDQENEEIFNSDESDESVPPSNKPEKLDEKLKLSEAKGITTQQTVAEQEKKEKVVLFSNFLELGHFFGSPCITPKICSGY